MKNLSLFWRGMLHSLGVFIYVLLFATFIDKANAWFGTVDKSIITPAAALMMFVFSALVTGGLVLGGPIMLYLDGKKKEGVGLLIFTGLGLFIFTVLVFSILFIIR